MKSPSCAALSGLFLWGALYSLGVAQGYAAVPLRGVWIGLFIPKRGHALSTINHQPSTVNRQLLPQRLRDDGVGQMDLGALGGVEAFFQAIAEGHEFIDFGDDTVLFGEGRKRDRIRFDVSFYRPEGPAQHSSGQRPENL